MKRKASRSRVLRTRPRSTSRSTHPWMPRVADVDHHRRVARDGFLNRGNPVVAGLQTVVGRARLQTRCGKGLRELMGHLDARASAAQEYLPEGQNTLCRHAGDCTSQMMKRFGISKRWQRPGSCCEIPIPPATKDRRGRKSKVSAGRPRGGDAMRLALRRQLTGPNMRALHDMPQAAGGLRQRGPTRAEP